MTLDDDVARKLGEEARRTGKSFKQLVNDMLRLGLNSRHPQQRAERFKVDAQPLGLRASLNIDNIGELLEQLEGPSHR